MVDQYSPDKGRIGAWISWLWKVPVHVAGLHPKTMVAVLSKDRETTYLLQEADQNGEVCGQISRRLIGSEVFVPARFAGLKYDHEFAVIVQPWGLFCSIKQTLDYNDSQDGPVSQSDLDARYAQGRADIQFAVRQVINRTMYFWILAALGLIGVLAKLFGLSTGWAVAIGLAVASAKALFAKRALGLARHAVRHSSS